MNRVFLLVPHFIKSSRGSLSGVCVCVPVNVGHDWQRSESSDEPSVRLSATNCLLLCFKKKSQNNTERRFTEQGQTASPPSFLLQRLENELNVHG